MHIVHIVTSATGKVFYPRTHSVTVLWSGENWCGDGIVDYYLLWTLSQWCRCSQCTLHRHTQTHEDHLLLQQFISCDGGILRSRNFHNILVVARGCGVNCGDSWRQICARHRNQQLNFLVSVVSRDVAKLQSFKTSNSTATNKEMHAGKGFRTLSLARPHTAAKRRRFLCVYVRVDWRQSRHR